ncbi:hypothetical protein OY671_009057, partial [Metschnikowia pulcherrima]
GAGRTDWPVESMGAPYAPTGDVQSAWRGESDILQAVPGSPDWNAPTPALHWCIDGVIQWRGAFCRPVTRDSMTVVEDRPMGAETGADLAPARRAMISALVSISRITPPPTVPSGVDEFRNAEQGADYVRNASRSAGFEIDVDSYELDRRTQAGVIASAVQFDMRDHAAVAETPGPDAPFDQLVGADRRAVIDDRPCHMHFERPFADT